MKLNTSRDLVRYHVARAASYARLDALFAELVRGRHPIPDTAREALEVLTFLAGRAAAAWRLGDLSQAAALSAAERTFLERHASVALGEAARVLRQTPAHRGTADYLDALIADGSTSGDLPSLDGDGS